MDAELHTAERAADHGHSPLISIEPSATLRDAARLLEAEAIGAAAVMDGTKLIGVLSERDIARALAHEADPDADLVDAWMTSSPVTARPDDPILEVALQMLDDGIRHLPLVDRYGKATGMISLRDIERPLLLQAMTPPPRAGGG
jgi:CBS domain-containing protein